MGARVEDVLFDPVRRPGLSASGAAVLERMLAHPHAPVYRNQSGHRLQADELQAALAYEQQVARYQPRDAAIPDWLPGFVQDVCQKVPAYKTLAGLPFHALPTWTRGDLSQSIERFVPDDLPVDRLVLFSTSGTTGHPLVVPSHPLVAARYQAFYFAALRAAGIEPVQGPEHVGIILAGYQERCFTYVSVNPTLGESGLAKLNLHPNDWRDSQHRGSYLDAMAPDIISGDPISLAELIRTGMQHRPRALISTSMALLPAQRQRLETHFGCPVLDVYSMNEAGPIAVFDAARQGYRLLQPWLYVETLDAHGMPVGEGDVGEITLTGGFNFYLPLLRYRTGDFGILTKSADGWPLLTSLQGRPPVRFKTRQGRWINNLEVTHALKDCALVQYALHQGAAGNLTLHVYGPCTSPHAARDALLNLFGLDQALTLEHHPLPTEKIIQYTSAMAGAAPL